ncbi:hypothetical protein V8H18_14390 [Lautropia mirabilis]
MTPPTLSLSLRTVPLLLAALLASCGGSGDSGGASSNTPYQGTLLNGTKCTVRYYAQSQPRQSAGTDPLYLTQWYLKNTGRLTGYSGRRLARTCRSRTSGPAACGARTSVWPWWMTPWR